MDTTLLREIGHLLAHWVGAQFRIGLILSAVYAVGFALLGVPLWPVAALLCGFAHAIPVFGAVVAIALVALVTWMVRGGYPALGTLGIFAVVSGFEGFYLTPKIMGRRLDISPWLVFFGGILAGSLFGFVGVLLAVPVMGVIALVYRRFRERR